MPVQSWARLRTAIRDINHLIAYRLGRRSLLPCAVTALLATAACSAGHTAASVPEDSAYAGSDSASPAAADSVSLPSDRASPAGVTPSAVGPTTIAASGQPPGTTAPTVMPIPALPSPLADTVAQYLVFDPVGERWFFAAKRGKRLVVDIGRVDLDLERDKHRAAAYLQAVKAMSPLPIGTPVRLYDAWGVEDDTVAGFSSWRDRIVAILHVSHHLDSLVRRAPMAYAAVERLDTAAIVPPDSSAPRRALDTAQPGRASPPGGALRRDSTALTSAPDTVARHDSTVEACLRDSLSPALALRAAAVRDSLDLWLRSLPPPPFDRLVNTERSQSTQVSGCFGGANRLAVAVDLRAGANEWIRERTVLIDTLGHVTTLRTYDYRFKGHDFLAALDPNGGGVDGIVARGITENAGGLVVLSLESGNRLTRWVDGFAWEAR